LQKSFKSLKNIFLTSVAEAAAARRAARAWLFWSAGARTPARRRACAHRRRELGMEVEGFFGCWKILWDLRVNFVILMSGILGGNLLTDVGILMLFAVNV